MFIEIDDVLTAAELQRLNQLAQQLPFVDGRVTNRGAQAKNNLQIDQNDQRLAEPGEIVRNALFRNLQLREFGFPKVLARPTLSKYEPGMHYGAHVDAAMFPSKPSPMRSDISCTVFISPPSDYEGGQLEIQLGSKTVELAGKAGSAVFYPSTTIHQVKPVTSGCRIVAVTWIQSSIADARKREILYQLNQVHNREAHQFSDESKTLFEAVRSNLTRLWSDF